MYIFKNALRNIVRSKGRNVLILIIVVVIAAASCVGLCIVKAADSASDKALQKIDDYKLKELTVSANLTMNTEQMSKQFKEDFDWDSASNNNSATNATADNANGSTPSEMPAGENEGQGGRPGKSDFSNFFSSVTDISLDDMKTLYKDNTDIVDDFYSQTSASVNSSLTPYTGSYSSSDSSSPQMGGKGFTSGDFTLSGYENEAYMYSSLGATLDIAKDDGGKYYGEMFDFDTDSYECIVSLTVANLNNISVGDSITLTNPNDDTESYTFTVKGFYSTDETADETASAGGMTSTLNTNFIYTSSKTVNAISTASKALADASGTTDTSSSEEGSRFDKFKNTYITANNTGTYVLSSEDDYNEFKDRVEEKYDSEYTVTSKDLEQYQQTIESIEASSDNYKSISKAALIFLLIVLGVGGIILIVLNIFNIRERKYEIGVLTAIGMKKGKVAVQFVFELFVVTLAAIIIGTSAGAAVSGAFSDKLINMFSGDDTSSSQSIDTDSNTAQGFGGKQISLPQNVETDSTTSTNNTQKVTPPDNIDGVKGFVADINASINFMVVLEMLGVGIILTLFSSLTAVAFIMRYEPLKILSNRT